MESVVSGLRGYWLCLAHLTSTIRNIHLIHLSSVVAEGVEDRSRSHHMPQLQYAVNVPSYKASSSACRTQVKSYSHAYTGTSDHPLQVSPFPWRAVKPPKLRTYLTVWMLPGCLL